MEKMTPKTLLKNATAVQASGKNLLLSGPPGTGKSAMVRAYCEKLGLKLVEFNMATFDVYTDLIGIPMPKFDDSGQEYLGRLRPAAINDAHVIFFDEINRAEPAALNALLGICNERTINGEPLPNLQTVFAAMNPAGTESSYLIKELGAAMEDRLLCKFDVPAEIDVEYLSTVHGSDVANALAKWHADIDAAQRDIYISPRTLDAIGSCYTNSGRSKWLTKSAIPAGVRDTGKLFALLDAAIDGKPVTVIPADDSLAKTTPTYTPASIGGSTASDMESARIFVSRLNISRFDYADMEALYIRMDREGIQRADMVRGITAHLETLSQPSHSAFRRSVERYRVALAAGNNHVLVFAEGYNALTPGTRMRKIVW